MLLWPSSPSLLPNWQAISSKCALEKCDILSSNSTFQVDELLFLLWLNFERILVFFRNSPVFCSEVLKRRFNWIKDYYVSVTVKMYLYRWKPVWYIMALFHIPLPLLSKLPSWHSYQITLHAPFSVFMYQWGEVPWNLKFGSSLFFPSKNAFLEWIIPDASISYGYFILMTYK